MKQLTEIFVLLLAFVYTAVSVSMHNPYYCYMEDPIRPQINILGLETPYEVVRGKSIDTNVSSCTPARFWIFARHGSRLPTRPEVEDILTHNERILRDISRNYDLGRTSLCASDINMIRNYTFDPNITLERNQDLLVSGWNEMQDLAQRYQRAYPTLLPSTYEAIHYFFRTSPTERTLASLRAFADGLFGYNGFQQVEFGNIPNPDLLLLPYSYCPLYLDVAGTAIEPLAFMDGPEFQEMFSQVSRKLGFLGSHQLRASEIIILMTICKYEQIMDIESRPPLCAAFSIGNQQVYEYYDDLDSYYRHGYGHSAYRLLFENVNCHLQQDLLRFIRSDDVTEPKARIFNGHLVTLLMMMVTFGSYEDEIPLTRHNFAQQSSRLWSTSELCPMASNLAVVRYDCTDGDNDVLFLINEKPLHIPGCQSNGLCKQSFLLERFSRFVDANCDELYCKNSI